MWGKTCFVLGFEKMQRLPPPPPPPPPKKRNSGSEPKDTRGAWSKSRERDREGTRSSPTLEEAGQSLPIIPTTNSEVTRIKTLMMPVTKEPIERRL